MRNVRGGRRWRRAAAVLAASTAFACSGGGRAGQAPVSRPAVDVHQAGQVIAGAETWAPHRDTVPCPGCPPVPARVGPPGPDATKTIACLVDGVWRGCGAVTFDNFGLPPGPGPDDMRDAQGNVVRPG